MRCEGKYAIGLPGIISLILKELQGEKITIFSLDQEMIPTPRLVKKQKALVLFFSHFCGLGGKWIEQYFLSDHLPGLCFSVPEFNEHKALVFLMMLLDL